MRIDADTGVTTLDEVRAPERPPIAPTVHPIDTAAPSEPPDPAGDVSEARARFGGTNLGACFFGWLVAAGTAVLLVGVVAVALAVVESTVDLTQRDAERQAGAIATASGVVLLVVLLVGYYAGGYVAGRMSRFDGARQGVGVWAIGLAVTFVAVGLLAAARSQYDLIDDVDLPQLAMSVKQVAWGAAAAVAVALGTLLAAALGGVIGRRYHDRVDRAVHG